MPQSSIIRKVIENGMKAEIANISDCKAVLGSKSAVQSIGAFYKKHEIHFEMILHNLLLESFETEEYASKEQFTQMKRLLGAFPAFLRACLDESELTAKQNDEGEDALDDSYSEDVQDD